MNATKNKQGMSGLSFIWQIRCRFRAEGNKLRAEGDKLWAEGNKLWAEGDKLWAEGNKLWAEGDKLWAEGDKLWAEGDKLWAEAIVEAHGNILFEWEYVESKKDYICILENGERFDP